MIWIFVIWLIGFMICAVCTTLFALNEKEYTLDMLFDDITYCLCSWISIAFSVTKLFVDDKVLFTNIYDKDKEL